MTLYRHIKYRPAALFGLCLALSLSSFACRSLNEKPTQESSVAAKEKSAAPTSIKSISGMRGYFGADWDNLKRGYTEGLAQMAALYPDHEICFLGREFEYMHDLAQLLAPNPGQFKLLNIPVNVIDNEAVRQYIRGVGIDKTRRILLVDFEDGRDAMKFAPYFDLSLQGKIDRMVLRPESEGLLNASLRTVLTGDLSYTSERARMMYEELAYKVLDFPHTIPAVDYYRLNDGVIAEEPTASWKSAAATSRKASLARKADIVASTELKDRFNSSNKAWKAVRALLQKDRFANSESIRATFKAEMVKSGRTGPELELLISAGGRDAKSATRTHAYSGFTSTTVGTTSPITISPPKPAPPAVVVAPVAPEKQSEVPLPKPLPPPPVKPPPPPLPGTSANNPSVYTSFIQRVLRSGEFIKLPSGSIYKVERFLDSGKRGNVYLVLKDGKQYIIKIPKLGDAETLDSFRREKGKIDALAKFNMPHAAIIEYGADYIVKDFVSGAQLKDYFIAWEKKGFPGADEKIEALRKLLNESVDKGVFVGDLNAKNLIWSDAQKNWVIVDSGGIESNLNEDEMIEKYIDQLNRRYQKVFTYNKSEACQVVLRDFIRRQKPKLEPKLEPIPPPAQKVELDPTLL